jgi:hypothetical protein
MIFRKRFPISANIQIAVPLHQQCFYCGKVISKCKFAISVNNKNSGIVLRKNLWIHYECLDDFSSFVKREYNKRKSFIQKSENHMLVEVL